VAFEKRNATEYEQNVWRVISKCDCFCRQR